MFNVRVGTYKLPVFPMMLAKYSINSTWGLLGFQTRILLSLPQERSRSLSSLHQATLSTPFW